jgi:predicted transcriptional regulator
MGRSEKIYALNTSVSDIVEFIEREKLQELNKATEDIRRLKVLLAIN